MNVQQKFHFVMILLTKYLVIVVTILKLLLEGTYYEIEKYFICNVGFIR